MIEPRSQSRVFTPSTEQQQALTAPLPLLVLAGAGTGKTTVLTRRIAQTILSGEARPEEVLALTFTDKAAAEMSERLTQVMGEAGQAEAARQITACTFHSFGSQFIKENLLAFGFDRVPQLLTAASAWRLLSRLLDQLDFDYIEIGSSSLATLFGDLRSFFSSCRENLVSPEQLAEYLEAQTTAGLSEFAADHWQQRLGQWGDAARAFALYARAKREACLLDFGDMLALPVQLLRADPQLRQAYRQRYRHLFVDEYQDTNYAQAALLRQLVDPAEARVMVIGDDDQAIYSWRGAVVQNILGFTEEEMFHHRPVTSVPMTLNRRSRPPILDLANLAIAGVTTRHAKQLTYHPQNAGEPGIIGHFTAACSKNEAEWIAARIREREPELRQLTGGKRGFGAVAILCRKRSLFADIGQALEDAGIPYELVGGAGFYDRWEIRDVLSYLTVLVRPEDDTATARILSSPRWKISARDIHHLGKWVAEQNYVPRGEQQGPRETRYHLLDAVRKTSEVEGLGAEARQRLALLSAELSAYVEAMRALPLAELVAMVIERSGYRSELLARPGFDARVAMLNLSKLAQMAVDYVSDGDSSSLSEFVDYVGYALESGEEESEVRPVDEESDAVKVMTVHQAKGLEFPVVFVPALAARVFPDPKVDNALKWTNLPWALRGDRDYHGQLNYEGVDKETSLKKATDQLKAIETAHRLDEERRLFYVAITRAERELYLSHAHYYSTNLKAQPGSEFWQIVAESGLSQCLGEEEQPAQNPARSAVAERASSAQPSAATQAAHQLLLAGEDPHAWLQAATAASPVTWAELRLSTDDHLARIGSCPEFAEPPAELEVPVAGLLTYLDCPRQYRYVYRDHLPVRPSPAAAFGRELHRQIERLSRRGTIEVSPLKQRAASDERDGEYEAPQRYEPGEESEPSVASLSRLEAALTRYRASAYGQRQATYVEWVFSLPIAGGLLRGRADRLDRLPNGGWQVIDFKSGIYREEFAARHRQQLALYALGVQHNFPDSDDKGHVLANVLFLGDGKDLSFDFTGQDLNATRAKAEATLAAIAASHFPLTENESTCRHCNYAHLCGRETGQ